MTVVGVGSLWLWHRAMVRLGQVSWGYKSQFRFQGTNEKKITDFFNIFGIATIELRHIFAWVATAWVEKFLIAKFLVVKVLGCISLGWKSFGLQWHGLQNFGLQQIGLKSLGLKNFWVAKAGLKHLGLYSLGLNRYVALEGPWGTLRDFWDTFEKHWLKCRKNQ